MVEFNLVDDFVRHLSLKTVPGRKLLRMLQTPKSGVATHLSDESNEVDGQPRKQPRHDGPHHDEPRRDERPTMGRGDGWKYVRTEQGHSGHDHGRGGHGHGKLPVPPPWSLLSWQAPRSVGKRKGL